MPSARPCALLVVLLAVIVPISRAFADAIAPGFDLYATTSGTANFTGAYALPAGFFGPGSNTVETSVSFQGSPTGPGTTDTILERLTGLDDAVSGDIDIRLLSLNQVSSAPVEVTYSTGPSKFWNAAASPTPPASTGVMTVDHANESFILELPVRPRFTFTEVGNETNTVSIDVEDTWTMQGSSGGPIFVTDPLWTHTAPDGDAHNATYPSGGFYPLGQFFFGTFPVGNAATGTMFSGVFVPVVPEPGAALPALAAALALLLRRRATPPPRGPTRSIDDHGE